MSTSSDTRHIVPVEPFDLVVFGVTGDLATRKLLPALYRRFRDGQIPADSRIVGVARRALSAEAFRARVAEAMEAHVSVDERDEASLQAFLRLIEYVAIDLLPGADWQPLSGLLARNPERIRVFYLAVGPEFIPLACGAIDAAGLVTPSSRLVIEKPIGRDLATAKTINAAVSRHFGEHQIFRIDHYLGKETVQNLVALRFANTLLEPIWSAAHIDHVQITVAETLGVEGRGDYYDASGALRDMVQNHILQLLCLVAMEPPLSLQADSVRNEKLKVLQALRPIVPASVDALTARGQYVASTANPAAKAYADDLGGRSSRTETLVAIKAFVDNWRWAGVPFYLRTGKRLARRLSEVVVNFRPVPHNIFTPQSTGRAVANRLAANKLVIRLQPDEGVKLWLMVKEPGPGGMRLKSVPLDMSFAEAFTTPHPEAYERLLMDVVRGNQTLFMRVDEVEAAWAWIDPIIAAWDEEAERPRPYESGTWGPASAISLIERDGRTWNDDTL